MDRTRKLEKVGIYLLLIVFLSMILYPIALIVMNSLKPQVEFMGNPVGIPTDFTFENFINAWQAANFSQLFKNSILITGLSIFGITMFGSMAAWALTKTFRGSKLLFIYFLLGMMIPSQATIITLFIFLKNINLLDTYTGVILVYIAHSLPLAILIFTGFFQTIPKELEEAALLDGCSGFKLFFKIILPISRPVLATVVIISGMAVWNDFFVPLILMQDQSKFTLPLGLLRLKGEFSTNWPQFFAAMNIIIAPIIVLFIFLQKHFINGLTSGSVKG